VLNWTLSTAESTVSRAVEHAIPVAEKLEKPLKRMDTLLCSSLDYVEAKVPAVKLPTHEVSYIFSSVM
jgi:perilipin-2